ncbi:FixH family protein [Breoghania sp.]|uniref:FixH family protein n=1 Tax=Breoghania sp. TaxID=2065378 RepID=UPI002AA6A721|nr:FixH family protein [Breoghania sp.]
MSTIAEPMNDTQKPVKRMTGRTVLAWIIGFFLVIFAANAAFIYLALSSWTGVEVESSYKAGQEYQGEIDAASRQNARAWQVDAHLARDAAGLGTIRLEARDKSGAPLSGLTFSALLERPTHRADDRTVTLAESEAGVYVGTLENLAPGQWDMRLEGDDASGVVFRSRNRVFLSQ